MFGQNVNERFTRPTSTDECKLCRAIRREVPGPRRPWPGGLCRQIQEAGSGCNYPQPDFAPNLERTRLERIQSGDTAQRKPGPAPKTGQKQFPPIPDSVQYWSSQAHWSEAALLVTAPILLRTACDLISFRSAEHVPNHFHSEAESLRTCGRGRIAHSRFGNTPGCLQ